MLLAEKDALIAWSSEYPDSVNDICQCNKNVQKIDSLLKDASIIPLSLKIESICTHKRLSFTA